MRRYIITGAPGTGKTSLIQNLEKAGYAAQHEISRQLIQEQQRIKGDKTPWQDVVGFSNLVYQQTLQQLAVPLASDVFVDRGLADIIAYLRLGEHPVPDALLDFDYKYYYETKVFVLPIWKEIYTQDPQRLQTYQEATALHELLLEVYNELGFTTILLQKGTVQERLAQVLSQVQPKKAVFL